mmetsp:Transcript_29987/g.41784  ORF Transcript_29987/g.41784 Transcript_29987/m.41784 type:complete len:222 (+) Transcript_29987:425-1090(+)
MLGNKRLGRVIANMSLQALDVLDHLSNLLVLLGAFLLQLLGVRLEFLARLADLLLLKLPGLCNVCCPQALPLGCRRRAALADHPVEHPVVAEMAVLEELREEGAEVHVVRLLGEAQLLAVVQVERELLREALAERLDGDGLLAVPDLVVLFLLRARLQPLPRQLSQVKVHQHVAQRFEVIPPALLDALVRADAGVAWGSCEFLLVPVRNVLQGGGVHVPLA